MGVKIINSPNHQIIKEACVESLSEAMKAEELGADRIELCSNLDIGGTTPLPETVISCVMKLHIPVMVMIRPRGGDFVYSHDEVDQMIRDIHSCRMIGASGIVTGVLKPTGEIDTEVLQMLVKEAGHMKITFHKAIDETRDILGEIQKLRKTGIHRVLSSGGTTTAMEGAGMLNKMIRSSGGRLIILAAGRVTALNLEELSRRIHTREFHGRKIVGELT